LSPQNQQVGIYRINKLSGPLNVDFYWEHWCNF
jgi:hypothetical protein